MINFERKVAFGKIWGWLLGRHWFCLCLPVTWIGLWPVAYYVCPIFRTERLMFLPIRMGYQEGQQRASWPGKEGRGQHCCSIRPKNKSI